MHYCSYSTYLSCVGAHLQSRGTTALSQLIRVLHVAESCLSADLTHAPQAACQKLATLRLGSIVKACDSAVPFLVGSLQDWADAGSPGLRCLVAGHTCMQRLSWELHMHASLGNRCH